MNNVRGRMLSVLRLQLGPPPSPIRFTIASQPTADSLMRETIKRGFDIVGAAALLLLFAPLLLCLAAAVAIGGGKGPIIYRHKRVGKKGRVFSCLKFRTMCADADAVLRRVLSEDPAAQREWFETGKLKADPRVTPIGRVLRSTSLDELPQLWSVFTGDMSLVGPRPVTQSEVDGVYTEFNAHKEYVTVRPGITGLWQVSGRSKMSYQDRVALDKKYVQTFTFAGDVIILLRTVPAVMRRDGAY